MLDREPVWRVVFACVLAVSCALGGCSLQPRMIPAPLAVREASAWPPEALGPGTTVEVYYVTTRRPTEGPGGGAHYSAEPGHQTRFGTANVRFGDEGWDSYRLADAIAAGRRVRSRLDEVRELDPARENEAFFGALRGSDGPHDVIVYVPGFNASFEELLRLVGEMSYFLGGEPKVVLYAWPAHSHPLAYNMDRRRARGSAGSFREFLAMVAERTDAARIHVVTSSAGAPVVTDALAMMHEEFEGLTPAEIRERTRIGELVFAAADQDSGEFFDMLRSGAAAIAEHITVYSSRDDLGLVLTRHLGSGDITIGRLPAHLDALETESLREASGLVTVVDATRASRIAGRGGIWAHSYWYQNPWVSTDLLGVLRHRQDPTRRGLTPGPDGVLWQFPADYPDQLLDRMRACGLAPRREMAK